MQECLSTQVFPFPKKCASQGLTEHSSKLDTRSIFENWFSRVNLALHSNQKVQTDGGNYVKSIEIYNPSVLFTNFLAHNCCALAFINLQPMTKKRHNHKIILDDILQNPTYFDIVSSSNNRVNKTKNQQVSH